MDLNHISGTIVDASIKVHSSLGPGLLESVYLKCLQYELRKRGLQAESEIPVPVVYDGVHIETGYRLDLLVEYEVIVETKSVDEVPPLLKAQVLSYLRLKKKKPGLLLNFNVEHMKDGIFRLVNNL
ncbi:MAG: GxxExxY protein [Planctomycetota bacterium]|jgi:GxxExxY protein|nr:MAG: GxxExxY protein [Planctomycetota bacterium]